MSEHGSSGRGGERLAVHCEDVVVDRQAVPGDTVRVETVTQLREQRVDVALMHERIDIVHVPVGRFVDQVPEMRQEGDLTIMPVVEEVLVMERRLRLVEEVHIRRLDQIEHRVETVTLRSQNAKVTRQSGPAGDADLQPRSEGSE